MPKTSNKASRAKETKKKAPRAPKLSYTVQPPNMTLRQWQIALRQQIAATEHYAISHADERNKNGEYVVGNFLTRQKYKVVYRGEGSEWNYCSCMDFKTSRLGTCKHIEAVKEWIVNKKGEIVHTSLPPYTSVYLSYKEGREVRIRIGTDHREEFKSLAARFCNQEGVLLRTAYPKFGELITEAMAIDNSFRFYQDAIDYILEIREHEMRTDILRDYSDNEIDRLLNATLYPYQREGVRFAFEKGKAVIADEMGLGKTIQAIATAEMLMREHLVESVLILCPTSLKYQWKREIEWFSNSKAHVIEGNHLERVKQYRCDASYKIISYHSACNDIKALGSLETDMLIMDEVQRLKNWNTQISKSARRIRTHYAVLLSGTPLENKLEELYSIMEFVDQFCLSPYYQFKADYIKTSPNGKVIGYQKLNEIGTRIRQKLIRRTKKQVALQMPDRQDKILLVPMTKQQSALHDEFSFKVSLIVNKWNKTHFISEAERLRLLKLMSQMRMVADSTYILDQETRFDTKVDEVMNILRDIFEANEDEKVVVFSQWERMTRLIAWELEKSGIEYENLHGGVPSIKRRSIIENFTDSPSCRVFLSTDAGSTGLNLQAASTLINIDLPWNPAVLEQRIARIYRLGQERNIQIINLVSHESFEEKMLDRLKFKTAMFEGVLDNGEDSVFIGDKSKLEQMMQSLSEIMKEEEIHHQEMEKAPDETEEELFEEFAEESVENEESEESEENEVNGQNDVAETMEQAEQAEQSEPLDTPDIPSDENTEEVPITKHSLSTEAKENKGDVAESPQVLVKQGVAFLSGLAKALQSPEETERLVNSLVETNEKGETTLRIPVADKQTVKNLLGLVGKLFG